MNDGTRDIGNTQAPVLLFRGLDPLSGPQAIYQAMLYSSGHGKQGAKGMKRIILIKDKVTMASFGFCFVEFIDVQVPSTRFTWSRSLRLFSSLLRPFLRPPCPLKFTQMGSEYPTNLLLDRSRTHILFNPYLISFKEMIHV